LASLIATSISNKKPRNEDKEKSDQTKVTESATAKQHQLMIIESATIN
jgi:hypothetical protein